MAEPSEIYRFIALQGKKCVLPPPWNRFICYPGFVDLRASLPTLEQQLLGAFCPDDLIQAGVFQIGDENSQPVLSPAISKAPSFVLFLKDKATLPPFSLVINGTPVKKSQESSMALLNDHRMHRMLQTSRSALFLVYSLEDFAIFWTLGLPAIMGHQLRFLQGEALTAFFECLGRPSNDPTRKPPLSIPAATHQPLSLVVVDWSPAAMEITDVAGAHKVREHLLKLEKFLDIEVDDFSYWKPSAASLDGFQFCLQFGSPSQVTRSLFKSVENDSVALADVGLKKQPQAPRSYAESITPWIAQLKSGSSESRKKALDELIALQQRALIEPLLKRAQEITDPEKRNLFEVMANTCRILHPQMLAMSAEYSN